MKFDRILRSIIPSVPVLARTPVAAVLDYADRIMRRSHPEWSNLPPASLRMRIGVGNHILRNHRHFIESGQAIVSELGGRSYLNHSSRVLELGCGCGRNAIALAHFLKDNGTYVGQDVDLDMIRWCQINLQTDRVSFHHANLFSKVYNPSGNPISDYKFPANDASVTLIISISVFSHLLDRDFAHYVRESARVLSAGSHLHMTLFLLDFLKDRLGDRWTFTHKIGESYVDSLRYPEAAVAYNLSTVERFLSESGLSIKEIYNKDLHQQTLIAAKQ